MRNEKQNLIIFELFVTILMTFSIYVLFASGVRWVNVQFLAFLIFMAMMFPLILEAKERKISIVNAKGMVLFGIFYWILLDPLAYGERIDLFPADVILNVFLMVLLFTVVLYIGYIIRWPLFFEEGFKKLDYDSSYINREMLFRFIVMSFFIGFLPIIVWGGGPSQVIWELTHAGRWTALWERDRWGGWTDYLKTFLSYFKIVGIQISALYFFLFKKTSPLIFILNAVAIWTIFNSGARNTLGIAILPGLLFYYLDSLNKKQIKGYVVFAVLLLLLSVMQFQLIVRDAPADMSIGEVIATHFSSIIGKNPIDYQRDDQFYRMLLYASYVPRIIPYSGEFLILRPFYHWIPRAIWKNKPEGITYFFEQETNLSGEGMTTFSGSEIGDFYLCQGWLGICIIGLFIGFLAKQFDSLIEMTKRSPMILLIYSYGLVFLFVSVRSFQIIYEGWYIFFFMYWILKNVKTTTE